MTINTNPSSATAPVSAPVPLTADPASPRMTNALAHAVLVSGELEQRMAQTLRSMSEGGLNVSSADLLKLQFQQADLSVWTEMVGRSIPGIYTPLKEAAGKMS